MITIVSLFPLVWLGLSFNKQVTKKKKNLSGGFCMIYKIIITPFSETLRILLIYIYAHTEGNGYMNRKLLVEG